MSAKDYVQCKDRIKDRILAQLRGHVSDISRSLLLANGTAAARTSEGVLFVVPPESPEAVDLRIGTALYALLEATPAKELRLAWGKCRTEGVACRGADGEGERVFPIGEAMKRLLDAEFPGV